MRILRSKYILLLIACSPALTGCQYHAENNADEIRALKTELENQNRSLEQKQSEIEGLQDSIAILQNSLQRCNKHATHAATDVSEAKKWANANGYGKTLGPYIDNVLYDLRAISEYSSHEQ